MPTLSVIILTRDRLEKLLRCLDRLTPQLEAGDEAVIVDTGSTDGTRARFGPGDSTDAQIEPGHAIAGPAVRFLAWEGEGSWAEIRNFGVAHARGSMIAFLDDDCLPATDWVARGKRALLQADAVGGVVQPAGISGFPRWWHADMGWLVGLSVPGHAGPDAGRIHRPLTANVWARASVCRAMPFQEIGGRLGGRESERYAAGREDAQWWGQLRKMGYRTRFDAGLAVGHLIDEKRLDLEYLRRRAELDGEAWAAREGTAEDIKPLAYQYWRMTLAALAGFGSPWNAARPRRHYASLMRARHAAALNYLTRSSTAPTRWPIASSPGGRLPGQLFQLLWDNAKTAARVLLRPWLAARPQAGLRRPVRRVAVVAFGYLGDLVILQSVLRGLLAAFPDLTISVVCPPAGKVVLRDLPRLELTSTPEIKPETRQARRWLAEWFRRAAPDAIVAPYLHGAWGRTLIRLRRPPRPVYGFDQDQGLARMRYLERLSVRVHKDLAFHETRNLCALLAAVELSCASLPPALTPVPECAAILNDHDWLKTASGTRPTPIIMLNPDAGQPFKEWNGSGWRALVEMIHQRTAWRIIVNNSRERELWSDHAGFDPARYLELRGTSLEILVAWLARCKALVTVDAGPQHLAHALGIRSLTLYGPMDERRWVDCFGRPIHRTIRAAPADLSPWEKRGLAPNHEVALIRSETVFEALMELMAVEKA